MEELLEKQLLPKLSQKDIKNLIMWYPISKLYLVLKTTQLESCMLDWRQKYKYMYI